MLLLLVPAVNLWVVRQAVDFTPGLAIHRLQGSVFGKLTAEGVAYQSKTLKVNLDQLDTNFDPSALLGGVLQFQHIGLVGLRINLYESEQTEQGDGAVLMPLPLKIKKISLLKVSVNHAESSWRVDRLASAVDLEGQDLKLTDFQLEMLDSAISMNGGISLAEPYPFDLQLTAQGPVPELGKVSATVELKGDREKIEFKQQMANPYVIDASGSVLMNQQQPIVALQGAWKNLRWPVKEDPEYFSREGRFSVKGSIDDYLMDLQGTFHGKQLPAGTVLFEGQGNREQLNILSLLVNTLNGEVQTLGRLNWHNNLIWQLKLSASDIHTDELYPDYSGVVNLKANVQGDTRDGLNLKAQIENLYGTLGNYSIQGSGGLGYEEDTMIAEQFKLSAGDNHLIADGRIGSQSALEFTLTANDLSILIPEVAGKVGAKGSVKGSMKTPAIKVDLQGSSIVYGENQLEKLNLDAFVDFTDQGLLSLTAETGKIRLNDTRIDTVELQGEGNFTRHAFNAAVKSESGNLKLAANGSYTGKRQRWKGEIETLDLEKTPAGNWGLNNSAQLDVFFAQNETFIQAPEICMNRMNGPGNVCLSAERQGKAGQVVRGAMEKLPLAMLSPWMRENIALESSVTADFDLKLKPELSGKVMAAAEPGVLKYLNEQRVQTFPFRDVTLDATLNRDILNARFDAVFNEQDNLQAFVNVNSLSQAERAGINGNVEANIRDIAFLNLLDSPVKEIQGELFSKVRFEGRLSAPRITEMDTSLKQAAFTYFDLGLEVKDLNLSAGLTENSAILLTGSADIGGETALVEGRLQQDRAGWSNQQLTIKGERLKVVQLPEMEIWASPDLVLASTRQGIDLQGNVTVPKAIFTFEELPENAVNVSRDEVIVSAKEQPVKEKDNQLTARVEIDLGDEVSLQGFGLKTKLKGNLIAAYDNSRFRLFNKLNLAEGSYRSYGQELKIDKGQLLFEGVVDDPGINLLASRKSRSKDNIVAYLKMTGTLKNPTVSIYTQPATTDSEALSYLLTGYPLKNADQAQSVLLAAAASTYGREYSDGIMATAGLDELTVGSTRAGDNSLIAGKKITPRLYARYIMDVITAQMLFAVEYKLTNHFSVEASSGSTHGVDLKYKIEFD